MNPSDEHLARAIQRGHMDAMETLVRRYADPLTGYLFRLTSGDRALAEDLFQETFLRVLHRIDQYSPPRPFKPWLYAIATNVARMHYRRADTRHTLSADDDFFRQQAGGPSPESEALRADRAEQVRLVLRGLSGGQREVIILRHYQEMSLAEIAQVLDIPVGTVKSRLSIGLQRLREALQQEEIHA